MQRSLIHLARRRWPFEDPLFIEDRSLGLRRMCTYTVHMAQFPSLTKRRKHTRGHGLYDVYPKPTGDTLSQDFDDWLPLLPPLAPLAMVAFVRRYQTYLGTYTALAARYKGAEGASQFSAPLETASKAVEDATSALVAAAVPAGDMRLPTAAPVVGEAWQDIYDPQASGLVVAANPDWTQAHQLDVIKSSMECDTGWLIAEDGTLASCNDNYPGGTYTLQTDLGQGTDFTLKPMEGPLRPGAWAAGPTDVTLSGFISAALWGMVPAPIYTQYPGPGIGRVDPGSYKTEFLALIGATGARVVWQMLWIEWELMVDDFLLRNLGGRGGKPDGPIGPYKPTERPPVLPQPLAKKSDGWTGGGCVFSWDDVLSQALQDVLFP